MTTGLLKQDESVIESVAGHEYAHDLLKNNRGKFHHYHEEKIDAYIDGALKKGEIASTMVVPQLGEFDADGLSTILLCSTEGHTKARTEYNREFARARIAELFESPEFQQASPEERQKMTMTSVRIISRIQKMNIPDADHPSGPVREEMAAIPPQGLPMCKPPVETGRGERK